MNISTISQSAAEAGRISGLARLIRQVCVLRERGDATGAARLEANEVATAIRECRLALGPDALAESKLQAIYAAEEHRVAEAAILSELLLPRLVEILPAFSGPGRPAPVRSPAASAAPASAAARPAAGPPAIPDLLDAMLAAERTGRH